MMQVKQWEVESAEILEEEGEEEEKTDSAVGEVIEERLQREVKRERQLVNYVTLRWHQVQGNKSRCKRAVPVASKWA